MALPLLQPSDVLGDSAARRDLTMSLLATMQAAVRGDSSGVARAGIIIELESNGLDALHTLLRRAVATYITGKNHLLDRVLSESVEAFIDRQGVPAAAAEQVGPLVREIGGRHARAGLELDDLSDAFRRAQVAAQRGLTFALGPSLPQETAQQVRRNVMTFIQVIHREARTAAERVHAVRDMSADERRNRLGAALLRPAEVSRIELLAEFAGVDLDADYAAVVAVSQDFDQPSRHEQIALPGLSARELLVPESFDVASLAAHGVAQVVMGPPVALRSIAGTVGPTRRGADLLSEGLVRDQRRVVPCSDLLGNLIVDGNPHLTELIVAKHLTKLEGLSPQRRLSTGELLLQWLERGLPLNQLARELGIPAQTAHSRMQRIRAIFGDAIDDPTQRLELIVALQATLPHWRAEA